MATSNGTTESSTSGNVYTTKFSFDTPAEMNGMNGTTPPHSTEATRKDTKKVKNTPWYRHPLVYAAVGVSVIAVLYTSYKEGHLDGFIEMLKSFSDKFEERLIAAGPMGPVWLFGVYLVTTVLLLPLWGFHLTTGYVWGTWKAALFISTTQALCAGAAFMSSRYIAKRYITGWLNRKYGKNYRAIDKAVGERGLYITLLLRLSPLIPFGANNYLCGTTSIALWQWVLGTFLGVLPGTTTYCYLGSISKQLLENARCLAAVAPATAGDCPSGCNFSATGGPGNTSSCASEDPTEAMLKQVMMGVQFSAAVFVCWYLNKLAVGALAEAGIGGEGEKEKEEKVEEEEKEEEEE